MSDTTASGHGRLAGQVAVVSGAGGGIGRAEALLLAREGASVVVNSVRQDESGGSTAQQVVDEILAEGGSAIACRQDVGDGASAKRVVDTAIGEFNGLDILVHNAATSRVSPIEDMAEETWDTVVNASLRAGFLLSKHAAAIFKRQRRGVIVHTGSESGLGHAYMANYAAAKEGLIGLTRSLARELGPFGVRCNAVRPRALGTRMGDRYLAEITPYLKQWQALGRFRVGERAGVGGAGGPDDVAPMVVWLCTDAAQRVNGHTFAVEGELIGLWSEPAIVRSVSTAGRWRLDTLDAQLPGALIFDVVNRFGEDTK